MIDYLARWCYLLAAIILALTTLRLLRRAARPRSRP